MPTHLWRDGLFDRWVMICHPRKGVPRAVEYISEICQESSGEVGKKDSLYVIHELL